MPALFSSKLKKAIGCVLLFLLFFSQGSFASGSSVGFLEANDLRGDSRRCQEARAAYPHIDQCDLNANSPANVGNALMQAGDHAAGRALSRSVIRSLMVQAQNSFRSQFAAAAWLGGENPQARRSQVLQRAMREAEAKCGNAQPENFASDFAQIKNGLDSMDQRGAVRELGLEAVPQEHLDFSQEFIQKRMLIAWIEMNRIDRFLTDRALSNEQKQALRSRQARIRETYPMIAAAPEAYTLRQLARAHYPEVFSTDSTAAHPELDRILFPGADNRFEQVNPGNQRRQGNEGLVNQILSQPLVPQIKDELLSAMRTSLSQSLRSIGELCQLDPCQSLNLSLPMTQTVLNTMSAPPATDMRSAGFRAACSCRLGTRTEYVSGTTQLYLAGATLGGIVLCPFTFGVGCYGAAAASAGLAGAAAANTYGAIQDARHLAPLARTVAALPGLTDQERNRILTEANQASGRVIAGVAETAVGGLTLGPAVRSGARILSDPDTFRPIARSTMNGDDLARSAARQREELDQMGVGYRPDPDVITSVGGDVRYYPDNIRYTPGAQAGHHYGEILRIERLPPSVSGANLRTPALQHPEMAREIERLKEMGVDVVVDTSLRGSSTGAYFWSHTNVIAIRPNSTWQTFRHEVQHAEFDRFIAPRLSSLREAVTVEGRSAREVLSMRGNAAYTDREIRRLESLIRNQHATRGIDESLATGRELDELGWRRYVPILDRGARTYGATHRVDSLRELRDRGIELTQIQRQNLMAGRATLVMSHAYDVGGPAAGVVGVPTVLYQSSDGIIQVYRDVAAYFNERTGDILVQTPDGRVIRQTLPLNQR
jgi:hypothetical protein